MDLPSDFSQMLRCKAANSSSEARYSDKIYLPQSFLASLLELRSKPPETDANSIRGRAMATRHQQLYTASSDDGHSNDEHANNDRSYLPSPMIFRIVRRKTTLSENNQSTDRGIAFCGVREFSCEEGEVAITGWIMQNTGLMEGDSVSVEFVRPKKGTFAVLQAQDMAAQSVGDLRALLEAHMRARLTVLSLGQEFQVPVGGVDKPLVFSVAALEPMDVVDIVDTDLSVDIVHVDGDVISDRPKDDVEQQQHTDELMPGVTSDIKITKDRPCVFQLHIPADVENIEISVVCQPGSDASLCASRILRNPGILDNEWFDYSPPSQQTKTLHINSAQLPSGSNTIYVAVIGYTDTCIATIEARFDAPANHLQTNISESQTNDSLGIDERLCNNCGSSVPIARFEMHRAVCERHNVKCPSCSRIFKRGSTEHSQHWHCDICGEVGELGDLSKHMDFYHTPCTCTCDSSHNYPSLTALADHRRSHCETRLIECQYCHTIVAQGAVSTAAEATMLGQHAHEYECGSRSITCVKCKAYVRIRQVQVHMRVHEMKEAEVRANMVPCVNKECRRERANNPLGLCSICFGPFYSGQYDPGNQKLLKRLARNLHMQLTSGCGSTACRNIHCASGKANAIANTSPSPLSQTEAAAMLVPVLKAYAPLATATSGHSTIDYSGIDLHLCV
ncbi:hypothetical protein H4S08_000607 [Coemansia sp. RSA 1365]|nr:hypothetical protein H4S08_000607 [Coemansia sp. RSA 1365]